MRNDVPAAVPLIGLAAGIACGGGWREVIAAIAIAILILIIAWGRRSDRPSTAAWLGRSAVFTLFFALGIVAAIRSEHRRSEERAAFERINPNRFATIEAPIDRDWSPRGETFVLRTRRFRANGVEFDAPLAVYARFEPPPIGMQARIHAEGFVRVSERGYALTVKSPVLLAYDGELSPYDPARWNRALAQRVREHGSEADRRLRQDEASLVEAIVLGRGERLTDNVRDGFKRGGTYHLLVFSGLQIAFAAALLAMALRWLHAPRAADWSLIVFAILAPLFIGPTASVVRASVGIGFYALSRIFKRPTSFVNLWCVAALVELILDPRVIGDAGFQLTYAGAGALLFIGKAFATRRWLAHAAAAELAIAPLTLFHFHQFALGGSLLTILLTPIVFAMLVAGVAACAFPCAPIFTIIRALHHLCIALNDVGAHASGFFAAPPRAALIFAAFSALIAVALLREKRRAIAVALVMLVPTAAAIVRSRSMRTVAHPTITFLDVGQGDAILIRSGATTILVDSGGRNDDTRFGESRLLPMLADRGVRRIDVAVLTHAHPDHCGGMPAAIARMEVGELWLSPRRFRGDCAQRILEVARSTRIHAVHDGETRTVGEVGFSVHLADRTFKRAPENNASVVLIAKVANRRILLTGDIEKEAESWLSDRDLRADVLKVAHHGSRSSSIPLLLDVIAPRIAVISCGRHNLFGHPHPSVLEALSERGVRTWRTDRNGAIDLELRDGHIFVHPEIDTLISPELE